MSRKVVAYFFLLIAPVSYAFIRGGENPVAAVAPDRPGDTLPVDSTYYLPAAFGKKFPKREDVAHVYGYAHLYWTDLMEGHKSRKYFQLTDGLKVLQYKDSTFRRELSAGQIDSLYAFLGAKKNFRPKEESACFFPRHTFVFCNAANQVTGQLEVCLQCDQLSSTPFPASRVFSLGGLSREGKAALKVFCAQTGLVTDFRK